MSVTSPITDKQESMKKAELIKAVAKEANLTLADATEAVNATFGILRKAMLEGDSFSVERFFALSIVERKARMGLNPQTGEKIQIPATKTLKLKQSPVFKKELNGKV